ncbi:MAG: cbb3-type cytochrome oxidase assembly protein CcoS [Flavobacteriales bacterium]|nr:cbb3-type cytochrome oxidase assembly protein CcoS [Flavobacteriales bacterium]
MSVIFLLITVSTLVAGLFLAAFIWAVRKGQYDDDRSPAVRILLDDGVRGEGLKANGEWSAVNGGTPHSPVAIDHSSASASAPPPSPATRTTHHPAQPVAP